MDLLDRTKEICKLYDIWPSRSKGQNFLITESIYDKIVAAADLSKDDTVLEVGPGLGFLTAKLAKAAKQVIAVELDDKLAAYLRDAITDGSVDNVEIFNENILDLDLKNTKYQIPLAASRVRGQANSKFRIVANLPYNITSVFLRKFLSNEPRPESMVLMLQKEVAQRICAKPGDMSLLALSVQFYAEPEIIEFVPKNNFWPAPKVDSAIIKIKNIRLAPSESPDQGTLTKSAAVGTQYFAFQSVARDSAEANFFRLAKFGFSAKRKMLKNNLAGGLHITPAEAEKALVEIGLDPKIRAEDLALDDWVKLAGKFFSL